MRTPLFRVALVLVLMLARDPGEASAQESMRTTVGTRFVIQAPAFVANLGSRRAACEAEVAQQMAELCRMQLSYLDWRALTLPPAATDPPWVFQVTMAGEGASAIPEVVLTLEKVLRGTPQPLLIRETLYLANDLSQPTQDEARLRDDLRGRIRALLSNEQVTRRLQERFLAGIPVSRALVVDPAAQRFIVPAPWSELLPGEGSILRATYEVAQDTNRVRAWVKLLPREDLPGRKGVGCLVRSFNFPPLQGDFPPPYRVDQPPWHESLPASLSKAVTNSIFVFMLEYVKDFTFGTTLDGLVEDPFSAPVGGGVP